MMDSNSVKAPSPLNFHCVIATDAPPIDVKLMQKAVGMLNYLALHTCPDIAFTVNVLAQFSLAPTQSHWSMIKHLLRYLRGAMDVGINYIKDNSPNALCGWLMPIMVHVSLGLNSDNRTQGFGGHFYMYFSRRREIQ
jgi:hypothetical protein